jgi:hypothetical protein
MLRWRRTKSKSHIANDVSSLELPLEAALEKESRRWRWGWINTPIAIWTLTTIAAGTVGYLYTNYSVCRTGQFADDNMMNLIVTEAGVRTQRILKIVKHNKHIIDDSLISQLKEYLNNNDKTYVFSEFKGKSVGELVTDADRIQKKWKIGKDGAINYYVLDPLEELYSEVTGHSLGYAPDKETIGEDIEKLSIADEMTADVSEHYIEPSVCVKKALWPF